MSFKKVVIKKVRRGGKKNRKYGRNKVKCAVYRLLKKREKSHIRRIIRHLRRHQNDKVATEALERYKSLLV